MKLSRSLIIVALGAIIGQTNPSAGQQIDQSGKGAVLCTWEIMVGVRNDIDVCFPGEFSQLRARVSTWVDATNDFIIANSPTPITKPQLEAAIAQRLARSRSQAAKTPGPVSESRHCQYVRSNFILPMDEGMMKMSPDERRQELLDFLSVPRRPVMNPCL